MLAATLCGLLAGCTAMAQCFRSSVFSQLSGFAAQWIRSSVDSQLSGFVIKGQTLARNRLSPQATDSEFLSVAIDPPCTGDARKRYLTMGSASARCKPHHGEAPWCRDRWQTLCGTLQPHGQRIHLLSLLDHTSGGVLTQLKTNPKTNGHRTVMLLLKSLVLDCMW